MPPLLDAPNCCVWSPQPVAKSVEMPKNIDHPRIAFSFDVLVSGQRAKPVTKKTRPPASTQRSRT
jgi:hypothetical protein